MQKSAEPISPITTRNELAKVAGVSHDTIAKVEKIERKAPEAVKKQLRTGEISINKAYNAAVMRFTSLYSDLVHKLYTFTPKALKSRLQALTSGLQTIIFWTNCINL